MKASQPMIFATMMRPIALAAILGALLAAGAFYAAGESGWRNAITVWLGASERAPTAALTSEDWPICTVMGSMIGSEADWARLYPDFAAGKKALVAEDWNGAIAALKLAALRDPRNADIQNYIGYAYRRLPYDGHTLGTVIPQMPGQAVSGTVVARVVASQIPRCISSSEKNHGLRFEGVLKSICKEIALQRPKSGKFDYLSAPGHSAHSIALEFFTDD